MGLTAEGAATVLGGADFTGCGAGFCGGVTVEGLGFAETDVVAWGGGGTTGLTAAGDRARGSAGSSNPIATAHVSTAHRAGSREVP